MVSRCVFVGTGRFLCVSVFCALSSISVVNVAPNDSHTGMILACDEGSTFFFFYSAAQGESGDWLYCCCAGAEA